MSVLDTPTLCTKNVDVLIIGSGFSGLLILTRLKRDMPAGTKLMLVSESGWDDWIRVGGPAYMSPAGNLCPLRLNVPAGKMSMFSEEPNDFVDFLNIGKLHEEESIQGAFVRRSHYGRYLAAIYAEPPQHCEVVRLAAKVTEVIPVPESPGQPEFLILTDKGDRIGATRVVMALGNASPRFLPKAGVEDPWKMTSSDWWHRVQELNDDPSAEILLVGTGLTAVDMHSLFRGFGYTGRIRMQSRRGKLPEAHRQNESSPKPYKPEFPEDDFGSYSLVAKLHWFRKQVDTAEFFGYDWRDVVNGFRPYITEIWSEMDDYQQSQFIRHLKARWELIRHRVPADIHAVLKYEIERGTLVIEKGRYDPDKVPENCLVVNCTGPRGDIHSQPILSSLNRFGWALPLSNGMGIQLDSRQQLIEESGLSVEGLYYVGPLLRGNYWEATAVPELRTYADAIAKDILEHLKKE